MYIYMHEDHANFMVLNTQSILLFINFIYLFFLGGQRVGEGKEGERERGGGGGGGTGSIIRPMMLKATS